MKLAFLTLFCLCARAEDPPRFEVASVKMLPPDAVISVVGGGPEGSRLKLSAMTLYDLVSWAYDVKPWQVAGGPGWATFQKDRSSLGIRDRRFDITAKADGETPPSKEQFRRMLQTLLADRFHVELHRETREVPVYALVQDKRGSKLKESGPEAKGVLWMRGRGQIEGAGGTMTQLVNWFSNSNGVDRPVIDQTGLAGKYDFKLEWSNPLAGTSDSSAPSIFTAMIEQLGLRLEPRRAPVELLVIDQAEMPTEN